MVDPAVSPHEGTPPYVGPNESQMTNVNHLSLPFHCVNIEKLVNKRQSLTLNCHFCSIGTPCHINITVETVVVSTGECSSIYN